MTKHRIIMWHLELEQYFSNRVRGHDVLKWDWVIFREVTWKLKLMFPCHANAKHFKSSENENVYVAKPNAETKNLFLKKRHKFISVPYRYLPGLLNIASKLSCCVVNRWNRNALFHAHHFQCFPPIFGDNREGCKFSVSGKCHKNQYKSVYSSVNCKCHANLCEYEFLRHIRPVLPRGYSHIWAT